MNTTNEREELEQQIQSYLFESGVDIKKHPLAANHISHIAMNWRDAEVAKFAERMAKIYDDMESFENTQYTSTTRDWMRWKGIRNTLFDEVKALHKQGEGE